MRLTITIGLAALALGTAFASVSALAAEQKAAPYYGRNVNDGGPGPVQPAAKSTARPLYDSVQPPSTPHYGRNVNDGGSVDEPSAAAISDAKARNKLTEQKQAPHVGRPMNDGGTM
jgi:hypothetical protein